MNQKLHVVFQASVLFTILAIALAPASADENPHTFGHAAELAGYSTTSTRILLFSGVIGSLDGIESLDGVKNYTAAETISFQDSPLTTIPSDAFSGLSNLQNLGVSYSSITSLASGAFSGLPNLQKLHLDLNRISSIPSKALSGLSNLKNLRFEFNLIDRIDDDAFSGLSSLQTLWLDFNRIRNIPSDALSGLSSLQFLSLSDNQITSIPSDAFSSLSDLQTLSLSGNQIASIPDNVFSGLPRLEKLYLNHNQLTHLNLSQVDFLHLEHFSAVPGNTITSVDLSEASLSQTAFDAIVRDLDDGDFTGDRDGGVLSLNLRGADLSRVTNYELMATWDDLETIDLSFASLGSDRIDYLTGNIAGLNDLTISRDQWDDFSPTIQNNLNAWNAMAGNTLAIVVPEPNSFALATLALGAMLGTRRRQRQCRRRSKREIVNATTV